MPNDVADYTSSVVVQSGSVSITGTPSVTIASGTVSISGTANINISSQSVTVNTNQPQTSLGNFVVPANGSNNAVYTLPAGCHAVGILVSSGALLSLSVAGITSGINYIGLTGIQSDQLTGYFVSPVLSVLDTQIRITGTTAATGGPTTVYAVAILDAEGVYVFDNRRQPVGTFLTDSGSNVINAANPLPAAPPLASAGGVGQQGTWTSSNVAASGVQNTPTSLLVANTNRRGVIIFSLMLGGPARIQINSAANTSIIVDLPSGAYWEMPSPVYTGQIWFNEPNAGQTGSVRVTELT